VRGDLEVAGIAEADPSDTEEGLAVPDQKARLERAHAALLEAARSRTATDIWVTREGEEIHIREMHTWHLQNATVILKGWVKKEGRESKRRELRAWLKAFAREIRRREKEWQKRRQAAR
jgi:hypothetical protein